MCPNTRFSRTICSLSKYNVKCELDCFNCKTGVFLRLFTSMFIEESNYTPSFCEKNQIVYGEYLTFIKKNLGPVHMDPGQ